MKPIGGSGLPRGLLERRAHATSEDIEMAITITGDAAADAELQNNPFALLAGMLLDQQFPMERAFAGPHLLATRLGGSFDPAEIAVHDPVGFAALCAGPPAVHRYPGAMAARLQALAGHVVEEYDGDAARIWRVDSAKELKARLLALPGFGPAKAAIFLALLGKQLGVRPQGWAQAAAGYGDEGVFRSVADVVDADSLAKVRAYKQEQKRTAKAAR